MKLAGWASRRVEQSARDEEWNSIPDQRAVSSCFGAPGAGHSFRI
jgi:hypothetical protein